MVIEILSILFFCCTSNELCCSRDANDINAGNNLLIFDRNHFLQQQYEINLLS